MTGGKRTVVVGCSKLTTSYGVTHIVVSRTRMVRIAERAVRMMMMPMIAMIPVTVHRPAMPTIPPVWVIAPVPRRSPASPERIPEPVVDIRTIDIYRLYDIVGTIYILITDNLCGHLTGSFILLHIDGCNILEYILGQYSLDNYQVLVVGIRFHYAKVIHYSITIEVKIGKSGIGVVEQSLKLLHVLNSSEQCSHRFQVERLAYVL